MLKKMAQTLSHMQSLNNQNISEDLLKQITLQQEMLKKMIKGIKEVILPKWNKKDLEDVPKDVLKDIYQGN